MLVAAVFENEQLTYGEFNQRANQLAHYLREMGVGRRGEGVGLCVERSLEMVVGLLGVMKAGGASSAVGRRLSARASRQHYQGCASAELSCASMNPI